ncbi:MAG: FAD-dependent oxidoreductase [Bacteroidota bacterium]
MPSLSYWESQTFIGQPDLVIVGAGFVGLRTALSIREQERIHALEPSDILVVDRHAFGLGASTRNAGFACFGSPTEILADLENGRPEAVWQTVMRRYKGVQRLRQELSETPYWQGQGGYEVFLDKDKYEYVRDNLSELNRELSERLGPDAQWLPTDKPTGLQSDYPVLYNRAEAKLQPAALLKNLQEQCQRQGIRFLFGCRVCSFVEVNGRVQLETEQMGSIVCQRILLATNAFSRELGLNLDLRPQRNLVLLTAPIPDLDLPGTYHHHEGYVYFRTVNSQAGSRVLIGGARHLDEAAETTDFEADHSTGTTAGIEELVKSLENYLFAFLRTRESNIQITHTWMGILAQGTEKTPIVKSLRPGVFVAARLAGMGVALSAEVGDQAAKLLLVDMRS